MPHVRNKISILCKMWHLLQVQAAVSVIDVSKFNATEIYSYDTNAMPRDFCVISDQKEELYQPNIK